MRTLINVENANCIYCMNDVRDILPARPPARSLHGWEVADKGEIIMIATSPDVSDAAVPRTRVAQATVGSPRDPECGARSLLSPSDERPPHHPLSTR